MIVQRSTVPSAAAVALTMLLAVGCSSGDDGASTTTRDDAPTTTAPVDETTSTTESPVPAADDASIELAVAASLQLDDFADPWVVFEEGRVADGTGAMCAEGTDSAVTELGSGAIQIGPYMQYGTEQVWVQSTSFAFDTVEDAQGWIETVSSDAWVECQVAEQQEHQDEQGADVEVAVQARTHDQLGTGGFESYLELAPIGPDGASSATFAFEFYRIDNVVIEVSGSLGVAEDAVYEATDADEYDALLAAYDRVRALLDASPPTSSAAG